MLNKLLLISLLIIVIHSSEAAKPLNPAERKYSAKVSSSCKDMSDGQCMIYTYCILEFKKDSVNIYSYTKASCTNKSKEAGYTHNYQKEQVSYKWSLNKKTLVIEGFEEFTPFTFINNQLTGTKKINNRTEVLVFTEGIQ